MADVSRAPNAAGWNREDVTVTLAAADGQGGSGVRRIVCVATGAQPIAETIVTASFAATPFSGEGETTPHL